MLQFYQFSMTTNYWRGRGPQFEMYRRIYCTVFVHAFKTYNRTSDKVHNLAHLQTKLIDWLCIFGMETFA